MTSRPRRDVVDPDVVGVYHCWNRCVRRAWLCGGDPLTGVDYEYRRTWIEQREAVLARLFAIEIGWHAEQANHLHLILRNRPDVVQTWPDEEVVRRMLIINRLTRNLYDDEIEEPSVGEINIAVADRQGVETYRRRLADISAFMASLDEYVGRRCNREENLTGAFWEGRFGCRNLEDETAILVCGIYIDLNQIRAGEAMTPEQSTHTSAYNRIQGMRIRMNGKGSSADNDNDGFDTVTLERGSAVKSQQMPPDGWLCELTLHEGLDADVRDGLASSTPWRLTDKGMLPITLEEYLALLDWTGRQQVSGKSGSIPAHLAPILERLHIRSSHWLDTITNYETLFGRAVGRADNLTRRMVISGGHGIRGTRHCRDAFT